MNIERFILHKGFSELTKVKGARQDEIHGHNELKGNNNIQFFYEYSFYRSDEST